MGSFDRFHVAQRSPQRCEHFGSADEVPAASPGIARGGPRRSARSERGCVFRRMFFTVDNFTNRAYGGSVETHAG